MNRRGKKGRGGAICVGLCGEISKISSLTGGEEEERVRFLQPASAKKREGGNR